VKASAEIEYFRTMARYNTWANNRLYDAAAALPDATYRKTVPSFFGSLHATLNHILVGDRIWMGRLTGKPDKEITALNQILYDSFGRLRAARDMQDERIAEFFDRLTARALNKPLVYKTISGEAQKTPMRLVLGHLINHQTHHRGQCHGLLSALGVKEPPPLDLILYARLIQKG
jgi:uncharacterized damage-inducible protein DinB